MPSLNTWGAFNFPSVGVQCGGEYRAAWLISASDASFPSRSLSSLSSVPPPPPPPPRLDVSASLPTVEREDGAEAPGTGLGDGEWQRRAATAVLATVAGTLAAHTSAAVPGNQVSQIQIGLLRTPTHAYTRTHVRRHARTHI